MRKYADLNYERLGSLISIFGREMLMGCQADWILEKVYPYAGDAYRERLRLDEYSGLKK